MNTQTTAVSGDMSNLQLMRRLMGYLAPFKGTMLISLIARVVKIVGQAAVLGIAAASVGLYVESSVPDTVNWGLIWTQVKWIAIAGTVVGLAHYIESYTGHYVAFRILAAIRDSFYYAMVPLAPARTAKIQSGDAVSRIMHDCERVEPFYAHSIAPAFAAILVPAILLGWMWTVEPSFVKVLLPVYAATTFLLPWLVSQLGGDSSGYRERLGQLSAFVADSIQGVRDIVAFGNEKQRAARLWEMGASMQSGQNRLYSADAVQRALGEVFVTVGILATAWWGVELSLDGRISPLTDLPAVIAVSIVGFYTSVALANNYTAFRVSLTAARRLFSIMDQPPAVQETASKPVAGQVEPSIHFRDVSFEYDAGDKDWSRGNKVFDHFSLDIDAGRHVALVGPSGTGKSTAVNLLLRHWDPQSGEIRLGDHRLTEFPLEQLQQYFAVVSQRSYIFNESIRENIRLGRHDATDEEIRHAAQLAGLADWIETLPQGYDTDCGERGGKLSGGQRQRIAIARAVLKDAPIVLLDEATSSLDVHTEQSVMQALRKLCEGRTTLTIAHRLSTIVDSDEILVMLHGKIAERGTHAELMAKGGWYAQMFEMQLDEVDVTLVED